MYCIKTETEVIKLYNSQMVTILKEGLNESGIEHVEKRFRTEDGISGITTDHFVRFK